MANQKTIKLLFDITISNGQVFINGLKDNYKLVKDDIFIQNIVKNELCENESITDYFLDVNGDYIENGLYEADVTIGYNFVKGDNDIYYPESESFIYDNWKRIINI